MEALELAKNAAKILDDKKAGQLTVIRVKEISSLADYFVIATGTSGTHVRALTDEVDVKLKAMGSTLPRVEGYRSNTWVLLDYGTVVVHVFTQEARSFYDLDRLWKDGELIDWSKA